MRILTERDSAVASVFAGAKVLTWVTDHLRIHESAIAGTNNGREPFPTSGRRNSPRPCTNCIGRCGRWPPDRADDAQATLAEMTELRAVWSSQLIEARERVRRASTVRVARPAPAARAKDPAAERLRDAGRRLEDVISGQRHAADVIGDINRRFDEAG